MRISGSLKRYIHGILLVLLAGFIISSVNYVISVIPEVTIPPSGDTPQTNPYLVYSMTAGVSGDSYWYRWYPPYVYTPKYTFYIAVDTSQLTPKVYAKQIRIWLTDGSVLFLNMDRYNDVISYISFDIAGKELEAIQVYFDGSASGNIVISFYDASDINQALAWRANPVKPVLSNKLILSFISWILGIILMIQAMHKFGILI